MTMSSPHYHPRAETLADFAAGRLDEARAVVIATHASMCARCAEDIDQLEAAAGALLATVDPVAMTDDALEKTLARTGAQISPAHIDAGPTKRTALSNYIEGSVDDVDWQWVAPDVHQHVMKAQGYRDGVLRLVKFAPGKGVPVHSHTGEELTLLLRGAYRDGLGEWRAGDLADLDHAHTHEPIAFGDGPCVCLIATSAPLEFKTVLGKVLQPFVRL